MGGGVGLVSICDYAIAVKSAFFALSEVKLGVIPAVISPHVIEKIGTSAAKRYFCTGENFNCAEANVRLSHHPDPSSFCWMLTTLWVACAEARTRHGGR